MKKYNTCICTAKTGHIGKVLTKWWYINPLPLLFLTVSKHMSKLNGSEAGKCDNAEKL